jgi:hypothetical protein
MALEALLLVVPISLAGATIASGLREVWRGLRAKQHARNVLQSDPKVLQYKSQNRDLTDAELAEAADIITNSIKELPRGEQDQIRRGLHQPSKSGARRFIKDIIGAG